MARQLWLARCPGMTFLVGSLTLLLCIPCQTMDLVKTHLMFAVREEVEVLREQIKDLMERNTLLEQENNVLKSLASPEQLSEMQAKMHNLRLGFAPPPANGNTA